MADVAASQNGALDIILYAEGMNERINDVLLDRCRLESQLAGCQRGSRGELSTADEAGRAGLLTTSNNIAFTYH